jgi:5-methylthioadenosine/S-adenosylhomocysteine deaminase
MPKVDLLITNGTVVCMDEKGTVIPDGAVAVTWDTVSAVGKREAMADTEAARVLSAKGGIIMPGFVNAHTHAAMVCFRGLADDLPLMEWLNGHIFPAEAKLTSDMVYAGALLACAEMIASGTTCFCDMYLFEGEVAAAAAEARMRAVVGEVLFDFPSPCYGPIEQGFAHTERLLKEWERHPLVSIAIEPHSPYLCAPPVLRRAKKMSDKWEAPLVIHVSETKEEVERIQSKYGKTPVAHLAKEGILGPRLLADHCVVLSDEDIALLARHNVKVAHNPESNMKLASGVAPLQRLLSHGVCVALGTDGCASNNNLDMLSEMDTCAKLHKVFSGDPTVADARTVLAMATRNGARALGMAEKTGSIEAGKKADIIVIDTNQPHLTPIYDPASALVYSARGGDVLHSVINGDIVMEDRRILTLDVEKAMAEVRRLARRIRG